jgi:hypothetical protein
MKKPLLLEIHAHIRDALRLPPGEVESRLAQESVPLGEGTSGLL